MDRSLVRIIIVIISVAASSMAMLLPAPGSAASRPLLMEGKRTLYQRVLTRPGAKILKSPGSRGVLVPAFTVFYVYRRPNFDGESWLEVGSSSRGRIDGMIRADRAIDWKQTMVVAFGNPAGRTRLPLFRDRDYMVDMLESKDAVRKNRRIVTQLISGKIPANFPAISIEPKNYIDFTKHFYLLPILKAEEVYFSNGFSSRLLKVASVTAKNTKQLKKTKRPRHNNPMPTKGKRQFKTGIAFVIDSTISMGPYIQEMREVVEEIYRSVARERLKDQVSFALIAYRNNTDVKPGLKYLTRMYADFNDGSSATRFFRKVEGVVPSRVSSPGFDEDAYAGVDLAVNGLDWEGFGGRYIVLITDAGARDAGDKLSATGLNAMLLKNEAYDKSIAIVTLHLLTPAGRHNHARAAAQYRELSSHPMGNLYYGVPAGDKDSMGEAIETMASILTRQIKRIAKGRNGESSTDRPPPAMLFGKSDSTAWGDNLEKVGYAMKLAYLGRVQGTRAPDFFEAWIADRDVAHPQAPALEVRVLLTKNQLSNLQEGLQAVVMAGERGQISPKSFFEEVKSAAALIGRDPNQFGRRSFKNLAESGLLGEYLDGLPYKSKVMTVTLGLWESWSIGEQQAFLDDIEAKIKLYAKYHDDVDRWIQLSSNAAHGDAVYPVPLDALP